MWMGGWDSCVCVCVCVLPGDVKGWMGLVVRVTDNAMEGGGEGEGL